MHINAILLDLMRIPYRFRIFNRVIKASLAWCLSSLAINWNKMFMIGGMNLMIVSTGTFVMALTGSILSVISAATKLPCNKTIKYPE